MLQHKMVEIFVTIYLIVDTSGAEKCFDGTKNPYPYYGTWTSYFAMNNEEEILKEPFETGDNCSPKSLWLYLRHGSRNPGDEDLLLIKEKIPKLQVRISSLTRYVCNLVAVSNRKLIRCNFQAAIINNYLNGKGSLCATDIEAIAQWTLELEDEDAWMLVDSGRAEMRHIGQRFRARFSQLFSEYDSNDVLFRSTNR